MKNLFKDKGLKFYISLGVVVVMIVGLILTIVLDGGQMKINDNSKTLIIIFAILGIIIDCVDLFLDNRLTNYILPILGAVCYSICLGRALNLVAYPISDMATKVNWFGGSFAIYFTIFMFYVVGTIYDIYKSFAK